jgi:hypothetical protein
MNVELKDSVPVEECTSGNKQGKKAAEHTYSFSYWKITSYAKPFLSHTSNNV